ncbi:MAG TPA: UDP-N-acetylglucosamine 2-epimerase, partial [Pyrinomonadaceae bacterium]|nr:UDP-N-acetylglucosamine 2-epimerase [Pyrinomonadaceae bacterium]
SGGVQEEAPSLGKPVLVLRENTERMEAIKTGTAKLIGGDEKNLAKMLEENYNDEAWINSLHSIKNPFGDGKSAKRIVRILAEKFNARTQEREQAKKGISS